MKVFVVSVVVATPIIALLLVLRYRWFMRSINVIKTDTKNNIEHDLLSEKASYSKYKSVATKASVPNRPARSSGDFLDFFLSYKSNTSKKHIEGSLSSVDCGEVYE